MEFAFRFVAAAFAAFSLYACNNTAKTESQELTVLDTQIGDATFYARHFQGDTTASGSKFDTADIPSVQSSGLPISKTAVRSML